jgi:hypothetical protein
MRKKRKRCRARKAQKPSTAQFGWKLIPCATSFWQDQTAGPLLGSAPCQMYRRVVSLIWLVLAASSLGRLPHESLRVS